MLLEHFIDNEGKTQSIYDSSNVLASKYDPVSKKFVVIFGNGMQYLYENVSNQSFNSFQNSKSQGNAIHSIIKTHTTTKLASVDTSTIKEDIANHKKPKK